MRKKLQGIWTGLGDCWRFAARHQQIAYFVGVLQGLPLMLIEVFSKHIFSFSRNCYGCHRPPEMIDD
jgi:hypothetical protein